MLGSFPQSLGRLLLMFNHGTRQDTLAALRNMESAAARSKLAFALLKKRPIGQMNPARRTATPWRRAGGGGGVRFIDTKMASVPKCSWYTTYATPAVSQLSNIKLTDQGPSWRSSCTGCKTPHTSAGSQRRLAGLGTSMAAVSTDRRAAARSA